MRCLLAGFFALFVLAPAQAAPLRSTDLISTDAVLHWISRYRDHPDPASVPDVLQAASRFGAFENPERAGVYVGFLAGVLTENPAQAEEIAARSLAMQERDRWVVDARASPIPGCPTGRSCCAASPAACRATTCSATNTSTARWRRSPNSRCRRSPPASSACSKRLHLDKVFGDGPSQGS